MSLLYLAALVIVVFFLVKWAFGIMKSFVFTLIVLVVSLLILYALGLGPFEKKIVNIDSLKSAYCEGPRQDELWKCDCIITPLQRELNMRFNEDELDSLSADRLKAAYILRKAFINKQTDIQACLTEKGLDENAEKVFYAMIVKEMSKFDLQLEDVVNWKPSLPSFENEIDKRFE